MSENECLNYCHKKNDKEKDLIIFKLKNQIFEVEQKINDLMSVEEYNKKLNEENIKLIKAKNNFEYQFKQSNEFYEKNLYDIRTENEVIKKDLENQKSINKKLYEENENLKNEITKILNDYEYIKNGFEKLLNNNKIIQSENKKHLTQNINLKIENKTLENNLNKYKNLFSNLKQENEQNLKEIKSLNEILKKLNQDYDKIKKENIKYNQIINDNETEFNKINKNFDNINKDYINLNQDFVKLKSQLNKMDLRNKNLLEENNKLNEEYKKAIFDINNLNIEIEKQKEVNKNLKINFQDKISNINKKYQNDLKSINDNYNNQINNLNINSKFKERKNSFSKQNKIYVTKLSKNSNKRNIYYNNILNINPNYKTNSEILFKKKLNFTDNNFLTDENKIDSKINDKIKSQRKNINMTYDSNSYKQNDPFVYANSPKIINNSKNKNQNNSINYTQSPERDCSDIKNKNQSPENIIYTVKNNFTSRNNNKSFDNYFDNSTYQSSNKKTPIKNNSCYNNFIQNSNFIKRKNYNNNKKNNKKILSCSCNCNFNNFQYYTEENDTLKKHILLLITQNQNLINELEIIVSSSEFATININHHGIQYLNEIINNNKIQLEKSLDEIEKIKKKNINL